MQLAEAIALIQSDGYDLAKPAVWADLGCGTGLFTRALAGRLAPGSVIYALDTDQAALAQLRDCNEVIIRTVCQDFVQAPWPFDTVDGLLPHRNGLFSGDRIRYRHAKFLGPLPPQLPFAETGPQQGRLRIRGEIVRNAFPLPARQFVFSPR